MTLEIRPARADEMQEFERVRNYAFSEFSGETPNPPEATTLCAFDDGRLAATSGAWPFTVRWNGAALQAAGVTMVSVRPEMQGRGLLRAVLREALPRYRENGQAIAILWASYAAIYQRFGFGPASHTQFYSIDPRRTPLRDRASVAGQIEVLPAAEALAQLKRLYIEHASPRTLSLHRAEAMWQFGVLRARSNQGVFAAIYHNREDEPRGYVVYDLSGTSIAISNRSADAMAPFQEMSVRDMVALDSEAYRALWQFLNGHDLVGKISIGPTAVDDPAALLLAEPNRLLRRINTGIWLKVLDAERALRERHYQGVGELILEVQGDDMCDWNHGRYWVRARGEGPAEVERASGAPDLVLPTASLASLVCGHASASQLYHAGLIDAKEPGVLRLADRMFQTEFAPHCPDAF